MKNVKILLIAAVAFTALPLSAANYVFVAGNKSAETKICIAAAENNLMKYKRAARLVSGKKSIHYTLANKLNCNEQSLMAFASKYGALDTAEFLGRYSKRDIIIRRQVSEVSHHNDIDVDNNETIYVMVN